MYSVVYIMTVNNIIINNVMIAINRVNSLLFVNCVDEWLRMFSLLTEKKISTLKSVIFEKELKKKEALIFTHFFFLRHSRFTYKYSTESALCENFLFKTGNVPK